MNKSFETRNLTDGTMRNLRYTIEIIYNFRIDLIPILRNKLRKISSSIDSWYLGIYRLFIRLKTGIEPIQDGNYKLFRRDYRPCNINSALICTSVIR